MGDERDRLGVGRGGYALGLDLAFEDVDLGGVGGGVDAEAGAEVGDVQVGGVNQKTLGGFGLADADESAGVESDGVAMIGELDGGGGLEDGDRAAMSGDLGEAGGEGEALAGG